MVTAEDIHQLPKDEKLRIMEMIWSDLTNTGGDELESPAWHGAVLQETTDRVTSGTDSPIEWTEAKNQLRAER